MSSRVFHAVAVLLSLTVSGCTGATNLSVDESTKSATPAAFNAPGAPTVEFSVPDMMCPEGCGVAVKEILAKQAGVKEVVVDFDAKTATVAIEEGTFDAEQALAALVDKQFDNSSLKETTAAKPQADGDSAVD